MIDKKDYTEEEIWFSTVSEESLAKYDKDAAYAAFRKRVAEASAKPQARKIRLGWLKYAAAVLLLMVGVGYLSYKGGQNEIQASFGDIVIATPQGSRTQLMLPDGSKVWLNAGSSIAYSQGFGYNDRLVRLIGSTAAGFSCVTDDLVFCVIGDLSFFYDQNALWNQNLRGNFRILLLNNGRGGIFNMLKGLEQSPARDKFVSAEHQTSAEGVCMQNGVTYLKATDMEEMRQGIDTLLSMESQHPVLLEVFTDASEDERLFKDYYHSLSI